MQFTQSGIVAEAPRGLVVGRIGEQPVHVAGGERVGQAIVATQEGLADERQDMGRLLVDVPVVCGSLLRVGAAEPEGDLVERHAFGGDGSENRRADISVADGQRGRLVVGVGLGSIDKAYGHLSGVALGPAVVPRTGAQEGGGCVETDLQWGLVGLAEGGVRQQGQAGNDKQRQGQVFDSHIGFVVFYSVCVRLLTNAKLAKKL